jgi:hypothetical protein
MKESSDRLIGVVKDFYEKYHSLNDKITSVRLSADKWTLKEIIGHLIDSASNNHQRLIRLQLADNLIFPGYSADNEKWLKIEQYNGLSWTTVLSLWKEFNMLIANIILNVNVTCLHNKWLKEDSPIELRDLILDYVRHLEEHLAHFENRHHEIMR